MNFLTQIKLEGFNKRSLAESDFFALCEKEKIIVLETDVPTSFYFTYDGRAFIIIKKQLKGLRRLFSMFHELAHHYAHGGRDYETQAFFFGMLESKNETEADVFALIALIPLTALTGYEFLDEYPTRYAKKLWRERQRIYFLYGV